MNGLFVGLRCFRVGYHGSDFLGFMLHLFVKGKALPAGMRYRLGFAGACVTALPCLSPTFGALKVNGVHTS
jgi:hypothetical protein